jgi:hypothetical protein
MLAWTRAPIALDLHLPDPNQEYEWGKIKGSSANLDS